MLKPLNSQHDGRSARLIANQQHPPTPSMDQDGRRAPRGGNRPPALARSPLPQSFAANSGRIPGTGCGEFRCSQKGAGAREASRDIRRNGGAGEKRRFKIVPVKGVPKRGRGPGWSAWDEVQLVGGQVLTFAVITAFGIGALVLLVAVFVDLGLIQVCDRAVAAANGGTCP